MADDQTKTPPPPDNQPQAQPSPPPDPAVPAPSSPENPLSESALTPARKPDPHFILDQLVKESSVEKTGPSPSNVTGGGEEALAASPEPAPLPQGEVAPESAPPEVSEPEGKTEPAPPESPLIQTPASATGPNTDELITEAMKKLDDVIRKLKESRKGTAP